MPHNKNKAALSLWIQGLLLLILLSIALLMHCWSQWQDFKNRTSQLQQQTVTGASREITAYIKDKHQIADLFVRGNIDAISAFIDKPDLDGTAYTEIESRIKYYFPELLSFVFTDTEGNLLYEDLDNFIEELCRSDIRKFIKHNYRGEICIHPTPFAYHFDIMTPWFNQNGNNAGVFFINYRPEVLVRMLDSHQVTGASLMLIKSNDSRLIEVMSTGLRDVFTRDNFLTEAEAASINHSATIPGTRWQLVSLPDTAYLANSRNDIILQTAILMAALWLLGLAVLWWKQNSIELQILFDQLHDSESHFRQLFMNAPVGYQSLDENGYLLTVNNAWLEIMGYDSTNEVVGHWFGDFLPPDQHELFRQRFSQSKKTGQSSGLEYNMLRKDGSQAVISYEVRVQYDEEHHYSHSQCLLTNVTKQKEQERIKQNFERQRQAIIDSLPVIIFLQDEDGKYLEIIAGEDNQLYIPRDKITGKHLHDILPKKTADFFLDTIHRTLEQNKVNRLEYELDVPKGHAYFVGRLSPMDYKVDGKRVVLFLAIDVTEQKNKEKQLQHSLKMDAVGQLTGGIAHDFNNLLSIIIGNLDYLKSKSKNGKECEPCDIHIQKAIDASNRGSNLIKQLLTFARHQHGQTKLVDINKLVINMDTLITRSVTPAIRIKHDLKKNLWHTKIDPAEFENVLLNLVINAHDAMPTGGNLTIKTCNFVLNEADIKDKIELLAGEYVLLCLTDTGIGMSQQVKEKALEPFFTTKEVGKGTGLGLSVAYGFMLSINGFININSELTKGTEICLYLPRVSGEVKTIENQSDVSTKTENSKPARSNVETILVVDDEADLLALAQEQIEEFGYKVFTASDGQQALQLLKQHEDIDLIFSDVIMPGNMNGYELAIKAMELRPHLKLLLASGYTSDTMRQKGLALFDAELLNKPYRQEELSAKLREMLDT